MVRAVGRDAPDVGLWLLGKQIHEHHLERTQQEKEPRRGSRRVYNMAHGSLLCQARRAESQAACRGLCERTLCAPYTMSGETGCPRSQGGGGTSTTGPPVAVCSVPKARRSFPAQPDRWSGLERVLLAGYRTDGRLWMVNWPAGGRLSAQKRLGQPRLHLFRPQLPSFRLFIPVGWFPPMGSLPGPRQAMGRPPSRNWRSP